MIGTRTYMSLSSTERLEVITPMTHEEFRQFCVSFRPDYRDASYGAVCQATRELLEEACCRIALLEGSVHGLRCIIKAHDAARRERLAVYSDTLSDADCAELAESGTYPQEVG